MIIPICVDASVGQCSAFNVYLSRILAEPPKQLNCHGNFLTTDTSDSPPPVFIAPASLLEQPSASELDKILMKRRLIFGYRHHKRGEERADIIRSLTLRRSAPICNRQRRPSGQEVHYATRQNMAPRCCSLPCSDIAIFL